jgi:MOSC domain-containing protein YiiM
MTAAGAGSRSCSGEQERNAIRHGCRKFNTRYGVEALQWVNHRKHDARRLRGVNCRVLADGGVAVGDAVRVER